MLSLSLSKKCIIEVLALVLDGPLHQIGIIEDRLPITHSFSTNLFSRRQDQSIKVLGFSTHSLHS